MDDKTYQMMGYIVIGLVAAFVIFNLIVIVYEDIICHLILHCKRCKNIIEFRKNRHKLSDLNKRTKYAIKQLREFEAKKKRIEWEMRFPEKAKAEAEAK